ncbi:hypothetical protein FS749_004342 [Ceratobasidium sp. UAMH 11750]|nr:hypothetical protein FS749_004342 [Ceratobasidium sp. UAMH 11750]
MTTYTVPDDLKRLLPNKEASIWDIIHYELPLVAEEPPDFPFLPSVALRSSPPTTSASCLEIIAQPIAPDRFRFGLWDLIQKAEPGTYKAVEVPWFPEGFGLVDISVFEYWETVSHLEHLKSQWKPHWDWLLDNRAADHSIPNSCGTYDSVMESFKYLYVGEKLSMGGKPRRGEDVLELSTRLLSTAWLSSSVLMYYEFASRRFMNQANLSLLS